MKIRLKFLRIPVVIALCFGTFVLPTTSFAYEGSNAYDCEQNGTFPMSFGGCRSGYYYEDWPNANSSMTPADVGRCVKCASNYICTGGFAGPRAASSCATGYYGTGANCTACTNKPAHSSYTGNAATNACPYKCDSGYVKSGDSCVASVPYTYTGVGNQYNCGQNGAFPMRFGGCRPGYYYEDWQTANESIHPDEVGRCIACPSGYTCDGGFAGPTPPSPCATGYYGTTIESCSACTNKPAHSTYTGPAATNSCPWECDSGYNENNGTCSLCTADQILVNGACQTAKFTITTTNDTDEFGFYLSAAGTFYIDWGDGTVETINRTNDTSSYTKYEHQYASAKKYTVRFGGAATGYIDEFMPTITFNEESACYDECADNWAQNIASITGDLGKIFGAVQSGNMPKFNSTFATAPITSIPSGLFASIDTSNATDTSGMFYYTFGDCSNLTAIPAGLFASIDTSNATDTSGMFNSTFANCSNLTAIPNGLFASIDTSNATDTIGMFNGTFVGCSNLTAIPNGLFASIDTSNATDTSYMFYSTFSNCGNLTTIPNGLFASIDTSSATNTSSMFFSTFSDCRNLTAIPDGLFASIDTSSATNTRYMFADTFDRCSNLTAIPDGLFDSIDTSSATNTSYMFSNTFGSCSNLTTIPNGLFASIDTSSATSTSRMFFSTFSGCINLTGFIPPSTFAGLIAIGSPTASGMWQNTFNGTRLAKTCPSGTTEYNTGYKDAWGGYVSCEYPFTLTTTSTDSFQFKLSAAGTFYVDCGNGGTLSGSGVSGQKITRSGTNRATYTCAWGTSTAQTIRFGGTATDYNTNTNTAAISFFTGQTNANKVASITGDLGKIFGAVQSNRIPRFYFTFMYCSNLTTIPNGLFDSIDTSNATNTSYMFTQTFTSCSKLTAIPDGLFDSINTSKSTNTSGMFSNTFYGCSNLTAIPNGLFDSIDTSNATDTKSMFGSTFDGCSNLTAIPNGLFASIDTSSATDTSGMFNGTFYGCSGLTAIPTGLFDSINTSKSTNTSNMFSSTFSNCSKLTAIPAGLFDSINTSKSTNTSSMFHSTFSKCSNLTAIPGTLFASIDTSNATNTSYMFSDTFSNCSKLTAIPAGLFASIDTSSATKTSSMFNGTFFNCSKLTAIPKTLFNSNISMAKTTSYNAMFSQMFYGCSNLTGYIPSTTFPVGLNVAKSTFTNAFSGTQLATECPAETELYDTYDGKVACTLLGVDCTAGYYLPANVNECAICPINSVCVGGNYPLSETIDQGIQSCATGTFAPTGSTVCYPHILHVGDSNVYLKSTKQTTPSLNIKIGNDVFYANMTTERTRMSKDSSHYLHVKTADNVHYYVCDDTTCPQ